MAASGHYDYDWIVIGSGFGGSASALRLAEKGHRVAVLECGARFEDDEFAQKTSDAKRYYWMPQVGLKGILRMTLFKDIFIGSGCGVGGGSLGYANTLYRARPDFYASPQWSGLADGSASSLPITTRRSACSVSRTTTARSGRSAAKEYGDSIGVGDTYRQTRVGVFLGESGVR